MAYAIKYFYKWKNRQKDTFLVNILEDGFMGDVVELQATGNPLVIAPLAGDGDIYSPIKPNAITIEFWSSNEGDTIPAYSIQLSDFYSDAINAFRVDVYNEIFLSDGSIPTNGELYQLLFSGFTQIDNSAEDLQDFAHPITLQANDNLGLLQTITLDVAFAALSLGDYGFYPLTTFLSAILQQTSLQLECNAYLNIFENTTDDRSADPTADFLQQTVIHTNYFINSDGTFKDCYTVLEAICHDFEMILFQANGKWVLMREGENRLFTDNAVPGTAYDYQFNVLGAITETIQQVIGRNPTNVMTYPFEPINANQQKRILRPFVYAQRTLTYNFPEWIDDQRFTVLGNLFTKGGFLYPAFTYLNIQYIGWEIPSDWYQETAEMACLVTAYDTTIGNTEIDRFLDIIQVDPQGSMHWLQFNPIPVVAKSRFSFSLDFFAFWVDHIGPISPPSRGAFYMRCRFQLLDNAGNIYFLQQVSAGGGLFYLSWGTPQPAANWNTDIGLEITGDENYGNPNNYDVSAFITADGTIPPFPVDGLFLIGLCGNNGHVIFYDTGVKNINLNIENNLGAISSMIAQVHKQQQPEVVKNNSEEDISLDDTIVNTISGTTLTNATTSFGIWVGDTYITKTYQWHRAQLSEALKLNEINTFDTLFIQRIARLIIEGDFFGLRYSKAGGFTGNGNIGIDPPIIELTGLPSADGIEPGMLFEFNGELYSVVSATYDSGSGIVFITTDPTPSGPDLIGVDYAFYWPQQFISLLTILQFAFLADKNFIIGIGSFDFNSAIWNATLYEFYDTSEVDADLDNTYSFKYIFENK